MSLEVNIDGRLIGPKHPPYIIAELSANHNGDINRAFKIMRAAKNAGADAIKLQTYTPDTITLDCNREDFQISGGLWDGQSLYNLYENAHMPWEWHEPLFDMAKNLDITIFSSPFDYSAVELLENLNAPAYKIASFELLDFPLIKRVAKTGKPMIMSTGMANKQEIGSAINIARDNGCSDLIVLHCVSGYPAPASEYNLNTIADIGSSFKVIPGLSDHTVDNASAIAAIALGACVVEKHVTLNRNGGGADDSFSIEPKELSQLCCDARSAWQALGKINYEVTEAEKNNLKFRRSIYVVENIKMGESFSSTNIKSIRPGFGMPPKYYESCLGKKASCDIKRGTPLNRDLIQNWNDEIL